MKKNIIYYIFLFLFFSSNVFSQKTETNRLPPGGGGIEIDIEFTYYRDFDGDTYGDRNVSILSINPFPPSGYVGDDSDCDDNNSLVSNYNITYYYDHDRDGFGDLSNTIIQSCLLTPPKFYVLNGDDCDDLNYILNPNTAWYYDTNSDGLISASENIVHYGCYPPNEHYINSFYQNFNWTHNIVYDLNNNILNSSRVYYDDFGRSNLSLSKDFLNNKMWASETVYDDFGRVSKVSFPVISSYNGFNKIGLLSPSNYSSLTFGIDRGYYPFTTDLMDYYSNNNLFNPYQATATHPYTEVEYDKLNPENVNKSFGGNQIETSPGVFEWKSGYSYTVPAAQEMYYLFGHDFFNGPVDGSGNEEIITKFYKTVSVDVNGVENIAFTDGEGKTLAVARAGLTTPATINPYLVHSLIGTQGFVDVCIPPGITSGITLLGGPSNYDIFNLRENTGLPLPSTAALTGGNCYRIVAKVIPTVDPKVFVTQSTGVLSYSTTDPAGVKGISYNVNYYDYSFNIYDTTGRLKKSVQPNGFRSVYSATPATFAITAVPSYMSDTFINFSTTYKYNTLGQLIEVSSLDEGLSKFAYRNDGQIRYSQSALQATQNSVSYTNYDNLSRPIESGVITGSTTIWTDPTNGAVVNVDNPTLIAGSQSERTFTIYDYVDNTSGLTVTIPTTLFLATLQPPSPSFNYDLNQKNLAGNVAVTYKADSGSTITNITWYSYDIYGRVEWLVKYDSELGGVKTIDYVYDKDGNVKQVIFQKNLNTEKFTHQYTYDANSRLIKVETAAGTNPFTEDAQYNYNISGQLSRVRIGEIVQGIDYVYTLGGALKSINHPSLEITKDPGKDGVSGTPNASVTPDFFGITLDYFQGDYNRAGTNIVTSPNITPNYSGNIMGSRWAVKNAAMDWPNTSPPLTTAQQKGYLYNYNRNNWLTEAKYGDATNAGNITTPTNIQREQGLQYDSNGNITKLQRTNNLGTTVDDLTYNYTYAGTNRLNFVSDAVPATPTNYDNDIDSGQATTNYVYNILGQLILNKQETTHYVYNTQGLVTEIRQGSLTFTSAPNYVKFFYNEMGHRIRKETNIGNGGAVQTTYYVLDASGNAMAIYYKLGTVGAISQTEIPIYGTSRLGIYIKAGNTRHYQITDHLGNVRAVAFKNPVNPTQVIVASYADYYPFGEQLQGRTSSTANYRYAYQGQEKDDETGLEAFQLRMWDGRLGRWLSPDPYGQYASPYLGMGNNPINGVDPDGGWFWPPSEGNFENGYEHTDGDGSWTFQDNKWMDNTGEGLSYDHGTVFLKDVNFGFDRKSGNYFTWIDGRSRLQLPAEFKNLSSNLSRSNISGYNVDKAIETLNDNAYETYIKGKCGYCAKAVRIALEAGGINTTGRPGSAKNYDTFLPRLGFKEIPVKNYKPLTGDIIVIQSFGTHVHGHIQMYNGDKWVSDFYQRDFWPGSAYRLNQPTFQIFR